MSRGPGQTMRRVHFALIHANEGWLTTNELVDRAYPDYATWQQRERHRFAVRKALAALEQDRLEGVRIVREGGGTDERARADLTGWTGRYIKTPTRRIRHAWPESELDRPPCRECRCLSFDGSDRGECLYCGHTYAQHKR